MSMPDFEVWFEGSRYKGLPLMTYYGYSKKNVVEKVKWDANKENADEFHINYKGSGKSVGFWKKKGTRWYREW